MRNKALTLILAAEAVLCVIAGIIGLSAPEAYLSASSFPFLQLAAALRALSLSGTAGNMAAVVIYAAVSLLPILLLIPRIVRRRLSFCDLLPVLLSALLFFSLYVMINPAYLAKLLGAPAGIGEACLSGTIYSVLAAYAVLRLIARFERSRADKLLIWLKILLGLICAVLVFGIFFTGAASLFSAGAPGAFARALIFIADSVPAALDIVMIYFAFRLIDELAADQYGEGAVCAAEKLASVCRRALGGIVLSPFAVNILQLLFSGVLTDTSFAVRIPVVSIALVLAVMLLAKWFADGHRLKSDNDLFI